MQTIARIRVLDEATISQIAAGEIIERPVSVVKELVENSLDAGASYVCVELRDGGRTEISVADDGAGIRADELPLALHRHGTSKLSSASDLFCVRTLGFRGEGLASIAASAASLEIVSRASGQDFGARITVRHGVAGTVGRVAASPGTRVTVRELFAMTPVRRDFLGSDKAEFARISAFLSRMALGWPKVAFSLRHQSREIWSLPAVADPVDRLEMVFGRGSRGSLTPVHSAPNIMMAVGGFTSRIGADRPNRQGQVLFVNGRLVRSPALGAAWSTAYGGQMMTSRYPYGVLALSLAPGDVDVNVHPTKSEVRFVSAAAVFDLVHRSVGEALRASDLAEPKVAGVFAPFSVTNGSHVESTLPSLSLIADVGPGVTPSGLSARALGQIDRTYIMIDDGSGLLIVDQHAAHERIAFETLEAREATPESAPLLLPRIVELTPDQAATLEANAPELAAAGIDIERFDDNAYRISALPSGYNERHFDIMGILDDLAADDTSQTSKAAGDHLQERRRRLLATIACHSVVRAHDALTLQEQLTLYERLQECRNPQTCPHGRPTTVRFDAAELAKAFKRT